MKTEREPFLAGGYVGSDKGHGSDLKEETSQFYRSGFLAKKTFISASMDTPSQIETELFQAVVYIGSDKGHGLGLKEETSQIHSGVSAKKNFIS